MGAVAGISAAFNAPFGGILYSFEEVCSHWTTELTWHSFCCAVVVVACYTWIAESSDKLVSFGLLLDSTKHRDDVTIFTSGEIWYVLIGYNQDMARIDGLDIHDGCADLILVDNCAL